MHPAHPQSPETLPDKRERAASVHACLVLAHLPGMQPRVFSRLLAEYGNAGNILASDPRSLEQAGLDAALARTIGTAAAGKLPDAVKVAVDANLRWLDEKGHSLVPAGSAAYPPLLATIPDPPPLLWVRGDLQYLEKPMIAMVGSRHPSAEGRRNARRFAAELAAGGLGICSGLALGIDAESHTGALQARGVTVAVLGTGIDGIYPSRNKALFDAIADKGAIVSEFTLGTPPLPPHFPRRNRIISGLSRGVLVVEAGMQSGSMITARMALEQGRDVFAIPGSIHNAMAKGCHHLISQGAKLVQQVADITEECGGFGESAGDGSCVPATLPAGAAVELATMLAAIGHDPVSLDTLVAETGMAVHQASAALVELELGGLVCREPAGYVRAIPD